MKINYLKSLIPIVFMLPAIEIFASTATYLIDMTVNNNADYQISTAWKHRTGYTDYNSVTTPTVDPGSSRIYQVEVKSDSPGTGTLTLYKVNTNSNEGCHITIVYKPNTIATIVRTPASLPCTVSPGQFADGRWSLSIQFEQ